MVDDPSSGESTVSAESFEREQVRQRKSSKHYPLVLIFSKENREEYGLRVLEDGAVEYFGDYEPDDKSLELHKILGTTMAQVRSKR